MNDIKSQLAKSVAVFRTCRLNNIESKFVYSSDFSVMMTIYNARKKISAVEISKELGFSKVYASKVIKHLLATDMITKSQNEKDKRQYFLYLTEKGKNTCKEHINKFTETTNYLCDLLGEEKTLEFIKFLEDGTRVLTEYKK